MKIAKKLAVGALAAMLTLSAGGLVACKKKDKNPPPEYPTEIVNGGFEKIGEDDTWTGWTRSGTAFQISGIVESAPAVVDKTGKKFFYGLEGGTSQMTGTLTSDPFKLSGTGKVAFKMGAGKNTEKVYVEFFEVGNDVPLLKMTNTDFDATYRTDLMVRKIADLSEHIGKDIYIKITDDDKATSDEFGYVNLDDFVVCADDADVAKYEAERTKQLRIYGEPAFTENPENTTIDNGSFETGDLTNWKILDGSKAFLNTNVLPTSTRYWGDRAVYGHGEYYLDGLGGGTTAETEKGAIRSQKFTLAGDGFISFMMGAGKSNCYVAICAGEAFDYTDADGKPASAVDGTELIKVENLGFEDPARALMLLRRYVDASKFKGKKLFIKVVDNNIVGDFGFINVDDFRVSMTEAQVKALQIEQYNAAVNETYTGETYDDIAALQQYYREYEYPFALEIPLFTEYAQNVVMPKSTTPLDLNTLISGAAGKYGDITQGVQIKIIKVAKDGHAYLDGFNAFDISSDGKYTITYAAQYDGKSTLADFTLLIHSDDKQVANGGFETGDLTGWTVSQGWGYVNGQAKGVISAQKYWDEELPYNQSGNYHLDGWNNGIGEDDTWTVRSSTFTLSGSGWITVKMGGHAAAVKVYKEDGTLVGYYKQSRFADVHFNDGFLKNGGSWADMATYAIDLSKFVNQKLYIELCDEAVDGWAHAFFDDVITYYATAPDWRNNKDTVVNAHKADEDRDETDTVDIAWVNPGNELDQVSFDAPVANRTVAATSTKLDLTTLIAGVNAVYGSDRTPVTNVAITKVEKSGSPNNTVIAADKWTALDVSAEGDVYYVTYTGTHTNGKSTSQTFIVCVSSGSSQNVINGGFETGDLAGWTVVTGDFAKGDNGQPNGVVGYDTYWGEDLPMNQSGSYHLDGRDNGIGEADAWAVRSSTFTLSGSGWITVKMGGNAAAVKVYKEDGTCVGYYKQSRFSDAHFNDGFLAAGGSWMDMATYAIDLSGYVGQKLYIELIDEGSGPWAHAAFDDVITYYATAPDWQNNKDTVVNAHKGDESRNESDTVDIAWVKAESQLAG